MYFYQKNFIYDVSNYPKTKDTTNNILTISYTNIPDLDYYFNTFNKPKILLSTGNFSPWGAKDVLLADTWNIGYDNSTGTYTLILYISNLDITNYDINTIKYLIILDDINRLEVSSNDPNFNDIILKNNTVLRVKFNNNVIRDFYLPLNTRIRKTSTYLVIFSNSRVSNYTINFSSNALQEINLTNSGYNTFPHFITLTLQRATATTNRILRLRFVLIDISNTANILQTYYFSSLAGQTLNTFSVIPYLTSYFDLGNNSQFKLELAWTSDGNTLTTENTNIEVQSMWYLPVNNFTIYF